VRQTLPIVVASPYVVRFGSQSEAPRGLFRVDVPAPARRRAQPGEDQGGDVAPLGSTTKTGDGLPRRIGIAIVADAQSVPGPGKGVIVFQAAAGNRPVEQPCGLQGPCTKPLAVPAEKEAIIVVAQRKAVRTPSDVRRNPQGPFPVENTGAPLPGPPGLHPGGEGGRHGLILHARTRPRRAAAVQGFALDDLGPGPLAKPLMKGPVPALTFSAAVPGHLAD